MYIRSSRMADPGTRDDGSRNGNLSGSSGTADGTIYSESDNDEGRKCGTQSHQSWIPCFIDIGYLQRGTGRSWKRCAFTDHFVMQICGCDYSGGIHCQPFYGSGRSMACVLDHGSGDCGDCVCGVSERREGIVEEIAKEII